jgi:DNA-directed RNA polymerase specialized sigma24 family protein
LLRAHESASDLVQSTFLELLKKLDGFDYRGEAPFRGWLYDAVLRTLRDKERSLRALRRDARRDIGLPTDTAAQELAACYTTATSGCARSRRHSTSCPMTPAR